MQITQKYQLFNYTVHHNFTKATTQPTCAESANKPRLTDGSVPQTVQC